MNVLFICSGNICRSPIAEALLKKKFEENNINGMVDSAGFEPSTINEPPDSRAITEAKKHGLELKGRSRLFSKRDFKKFDHIYTMGTRNYRDVLYLAKNIKYKSKVDYMMNVMNPGKNQVVPDPIHSGTISIKSTIELLDKITDIIVNNVK